MGAHGYSVTNMLTGLAASAFTWSNAAATDRAFLNDARMDKPFYVGSSVASGINVIIDLGTARQLTGFAALNSNAAVQKTDAALKVEASSNATFSADVNVAKAASTLYSSTSPRNKDHLLQWDANFNKRYWRLTWTWTGSVANFQLGELWAYTALNLLTRRSIYGSGETRPATVATQQMQYGEMRSLFLAGPHRQLDLVWDDLNATERDELYNMHQLSNFGAKPLLWAFSYEATATAAAAAEQECIFGKLQQPAFQWTEQDYGLYRPGGFSLRSVGREAGA